MCGFLRAEYSIILYSTALAQCPGSPTSTCDTSYNVTGSGQLLLIEGGQAVCLRCDVESSSETTSWMVDLTSVGATDGTILPSDELIIYEPECVFHANRPIRVDCSSGDVDYNQIVYLKGIQVLMFMWYGTLSYAVCLFPFLVFEPPKVPISVHINRGHTLEVMCRNSDGTTVAGLVAGLEWKDANGDTVSNSADLRIENVDLVDAGVYSCVATTNMGEMLQSNTTVIVQCKCLWLLQ